MRVPAVRNRLVSVEEGVTLVALGERFVQELRRHIVLRIRRHAAQRLAIEKVAGQPGRELQEGRGDHGDAQRPQHLEIDHALDGAEQQRPQRAPEPERRCLGSKLGADALDPHPGTLPRDAEAYRR